ncbi:epidermal growth factor-like protein 7 isoform X2 [Crocuta crocuta]
MGKLRPRVPSNGKQVFSSLGRCAGSQPGSRPRPLSCPGIARGPPCPDPSTRGAPAAPTPRRAAATRARGVTGPLLQAPVRRRLTRWETQAMCDSRELLLVWLLVLAVGGTEHVFRPGRRVCTVGAPRGPESESFVQRVYQPYLTTCDGHRACSTYRTVYRTAYRRSPSPASTRPRYACCPGWKRSSGLPRACGAAICQPPCQNGGSCVRPGLCHCPAGWHGDTCQTDVDECSAGRGPCPQRCVNTAGSYWCRCQEGHSPSADGALCLPKRGTPRVAPNPTTGTNHAVEEEVQRLRSRVDVLEQKLQLVLAPLHSLASRALEHGLPDPGSLLAHSFQQLDRIDSLSEQISFLEEQLGSCSCKKEL